MVGKREVEELARQPGMDWISALKGSQVRTLLGPTLKPPEMESSRNGH
jgi:hypothetical protein